MRKRISDDKIDGLALKAMGEFHTQYVNEVEAAIQKHKIVVVGMKQNPVVAKAKKVLKDAGLSYHYLEYGSYVSQWKPRLAIKLWSGWPTYPQIFMDGKLIGGCRELIKILDKNKPKNQ